LPEYKQRDISAGPVQVSEVIDREGLALFPECQVLPAAPPPGRHLEKQGVSQASRRAWPGASKLLLLMGEAVFLDLLVERGSVGAQNPGDVGEVAALGGQELGDMLALQFLQG
jgi:hypothetical protein